MYFIARFTETGRVSSPSSTKDGYPEIDYVEQMFIELGFFKNNDIRNKRGIKYAENLEVEGFYNHKDRRKKPIKKLYELFSK